MERFIGDKKPMTNDTGLAILDANTIRTNIQKLFDKLAIEDAMQQETIVDNGPRLNLDTHPFHVVRDCENGQEKFIAAFSNWQCAMLTVQYHRYDLQDPAVRLAQ